MERKRWTTDEAAKLQSMARSSPVKHIAAALGRGVPAVVWKAHQLRISLRVRPQKGNGFDPGGGVDIAG